MKFISKKLLLFLVLILNISIYAVKIPPEVEGYYNACIDYINKADWDNAYVQIKRALQFVPYNPDLLALKRKIENRLKGYYENLFLKMKELYKKKPKLALKYYLIIKKKAPFEDLKKKAKKFYLEKIKPFLKKKKKELKKVKIVVDNKVRVTYSNANDELKKDLIRNIVRSLAKKRFSEFSKYYLNLKALDKHNPIVLEFKDLWDKFIIVDRILSSFEDANFIKKREAITILEKNIDLFFRYIYKSASERDKIYYLLAWYYYEKDDLKKAKFYWRKIKKPKKDWLWLIIKIHLEEKDYVWVINYLKNKSYYRYYYYKAYIYQNLNFIVATISSFVLMSLLIIMNLKLVDAYYDYAISSSIMYFFNLDKKLKEKIFELLEKQNYRAALELFEWMKFRKSKLTREDYFLYIDLLQKTANNLKALQVVDEACEIIGDNIKKFLIEKVKILSKMGRYKEAVPIIKQLVGNLLDVEQIYDDNGQISPLKYQLLYEQFMQISKEMI